MAWPLPQSGCARLGAPDSVEVELIARGVLSAIEPPEGRTALQDLLMGASFRAMTGHEVDPAAVEPLGAEQLGAALSDRDESFRARIVQMMVLGALVLRPLPPEVADRVDRYARVLSVDDGMLDVAHRFAAGQLGLAAFDFARNGYASDWGPERAAALHTSTELADAWDLSVADPALADRWASLEGLPPGSLGRLTWEFYRARGFRFPGTPGSAPPLLAQHDWVHVLADYGTQVESELEVFALIARANDDPKAFSLLAMVVSLFETGYLATGAGLFESFPGRLLRDGMAVRVADAMRRGALSHGHDGRPDVDLLAVDWFELAPLPLAEVRQMFSIPHKSPAAVVAGSVGPWEPGGISEHQLAAGMADAEERGERYDAHGASAIPT